MALVFPAAPILLLIIRKRSGREGFPDDVNEIGTDFMAASFRLTPREATAFFRRVRQLSESTGNGRKNLQSPY